MVICVQQHLSKKKALRKALLIKKKPVWQYSPSQLHIFEKKLAVKTGTLI